MGLQNLCMYPDRNSDLPQSLPALLRPTLICSAHLLHLYFLQKWKAGKCVLLLLTCCFPASWTQVSSLWHTAVLHSSSTQTAPQCCIDHTWTSACQKTDSGVISALCYWAPGLGNVCSCLSMSPSPGHTAGGRLPGRR